MSLEFNEDTLIDLCELVTDGSHHSPPSQVKGYYMASVKDMGTYKFNYSDCRKISEEDYNKLVKSGCSPKNDDILIAKDGSPLSNIFIYKEEYPMVLLSSIAIIRANKNKILPEFLKYYLENHSIKRYIQTTYTSGSVIPRIILKDFKKFPIIYPNMENQKKIIGILRTIDKKIAINEEINQNLLYIADAIYKNEFQNFDSYPEEELIMSDFGLIPKNWYYKTLDEISDVAIGKTPPRKETLWFSEKEGVKWVSIKDLGNSGTYIFETSEYLTEEAIEKFNVKLIPEDTVILSFKLTVGRLGITTEEMVTNEAIAHFKLGENSEITKEYLYLYLKNFNYEELGSTSSIAKAINSKIVKKIPILIPNDKIYELKELFENIFNEIKSNQLEINNLTKLRDTLLPKLMSGEIDVTKINYDLND